MAERIQRKRTKGWRMPPGAIYVGRPTLWGNPFRPGDELTFPFSEVCGPVVRDKAHAVELFAAHVRITSGYAMRARHELRGHDLACWCRPGDPCHADVLLEVANQRSAP